MLQSGKKLIILRCVRDPVEEIDDAAKKIVNNHAVHSILLHEIIHLIDEIQGRAATPGSASYTADASDTTHWNDPSEFNAYFHNFADRIISFTTRARNHRSPMAILVDAKAQRITADFWDTFNINLDRTSGRNIRMFIDSLQPDRRRRLLSRYYKLHRDAMEYVRWAEAQTVNS